MPWNFVSCWSSSDSAPVSTRCSPSAMVPRRKRLFALIASLGEGRGASVDIAQVPSLASQRIERRHPVLAALIGDDALQCGVNVLRHRVCIAAHIDRGALLHPRM